MFPKLIYSKHPSFQILYILNIYKLKKSFISYILSFQNIHISNVLYSKISSFKNLVPPNYVNFKIQHSDFKWMIYANKKILVVP